MVALRDVAFWSAASRLAAASSSLDFIFFAMAMASSSSSVGVSPSLVGGRLGDGGLGPLERDEGWNLNEPLSRQHLRSSWPSGGTPPAYLLSSAQTVAQGDAL